MPEQTQEKKIETQESEPSWTEEQQRVINARNRSLLVSAAAGSGKTAVLVERILSLITSGESSIDVDELLVVTFTKAAAAEMRERLLDAVTKAAEAHPSDTHLQRQIALVHNAQISTIDSFCLDVVSNHFHRIGIEPGFRFADEVEKQLLMEEVYDAVLEEAYAEKDPEILCFIDGYASAKSDGEIRDMIQRLYDYSQSYPWPDEWLDACAEQYNAADLSELEQKAWVRNLLSYLHVRAEELSSRCEKEYAAICGPDLPQEYADLLSDDLAQIQPLATCSHLFDWKEALFSIDFGDLPKFNQINATEEQRDSVRDVREWPKKQVSELKKYVLNEDPEEQLSDLHAAGAMVESLIALTKSFATRFAAEKAKRNIVDYSDVAHFALQILVDPETKEPTETAEEYRGKFREVMVDEYQDSNYLQEAILTAVSGIPEGRENFFMVGDVKQSIYRFRQARPELFVEKYENFSVSEDVTQRIDLHKNFRSTPEVIETANEIFFRIMGRDLGNVEYDEAAALYPGRKCQEDARLCSECILVEKQEGEDTTITEAGVIARRIRALIEEEMPQYEYRDVAILMRSLLNRTQEFVTAFEQEGVPLHVFSQTGYFEAQEVRVVLSMLRVLDNPLQDIPLAALMRSPIGCFTDEEMARIKAFDEGAPFYACVMQMAEQAETAPGDQRPLALKTATFWEWLSGFRARVPYTPVHTLIQDIYDETGYHDWAAALPAGEQRGANLDMLLEKAAAFEKTSYHGLYHFIRYIDHMNKYDLDLGEPETVSEQENAVRLMTIHKSKGLEFPIVFVAGMGKKINLTDSSKTMIFHPFYGVALKYCDPVRRVKKDTLIHRAFSLEIKKENLGEELRVLYVALTRARDKLVMTGVPAKEYISATEEKTSVEKLHFSDRMDAQYAFDWVLPALARDGSVKVRIATPQEAVAEHVDRVTQTASRREALLAQLEDVDETVLTDLSDRFSWTYPYPQTGLKQKLSVSEIKHRAMEDAKEILEEEEDGNEWFPEEDPIPYIPKFVKDREENIGALRGTAFHRLMECLPFSDMPTFSSPDEAVDWTWGVLESLCGAERMEQDEADLIDHEQIARFLMTGEAERMHAAAERGALVREQPFVLLVPAGQVEPGAGEEEQVLIQGIIDVFWEEEDGIVLLDYKTDRVKRPEELITRYQAQLQIYAEALDRRFAPKQVKEVLIYSFCLDTMITVPIEGRISAVEGV